MTLLELEAQFPGLFQPLAFQSSSEAERHADRVAAHTGLTVRVASWPSGRGVRSIDYRDTAAKLRLQVEISSDPTRSNKPFYLFRCFGEHLDCHLQIRSSHAVRAHPSSFQREAQSIISKLRSLEVGADGRINGQVTKWNSEKGTGVIECLPGVLVTLSSTELPNELTVVANQWFSFKVKDSAGRQKAVEVRRCPSQ